MSIAINQITNANIYLNGTVQLGRAKEIKLPDVEFEFVEHKGLGLMGTIKLPAGLNALEGEVIWDSYYADVRAQILNPFKTVQIMARSMVQTFNSQGKVIELPLVTIMNVAFSKTTGGSFKPKEAVELSDTFQVYSINQTMAGKEVLFFDAFTNEERRSRS